jgi:hypothetical protein
MPISMRKQILLSAGRRKLTFTGSGRVLESTSVGVSIGSLGLSNTQQEYTYAFATGGNPGSYFTINGDSIDVANALDYATAPYIQLIVDATSEGTGPTYRIYILISVLQFLFVNDETRLYVDAMTTEPDSDRMALLDTFIGSLKAGGVWNNLDVLYILAAHDAQAARVNAVNPGTYDASLVLTPTFVADRGYTGSAAQYLDTGFNPTSAASPKYTLNDCCLGMWCRTASGSNSRELGNADNSKATLSGRGLGDTIGWRLNSDPAMTAANTDGSGHFVCVRTGATASEAFRNGVSLGTGTETADALPNGNFWVLTDSNSSAKQLAMAFWGASLTSGQITAFYNASNSYMTSVGAA